ncbi:MAG TPA: Ig domain-containing protein, partial [Candidatus Dormibacteraeota bacterium]|nr:Ig domain-containing protein [Candidatus Dormibacteraeota bacterium]
MRRADSRKLVIGKWAAIIAALVAASACSPQCSSTAKTPIKTTPIAAVPSPSPTPTAPLQPSSAPFHGGEVGVAYTPVAQSATGGVSPYTWSVSTGALPGGLTIGPDGSVSGTPTSAGTFAFTIQVSDAKGGTASLPGTIAIAPALSAGLISSCAQYCNVELGCVSVCGPFGQQSGGVGPFTYTLTQGPLPAGTSLNGLSLSGTFTGLSGWIQFTVQVG